MPFDRRNKMARKKFQVDLPDGRSVWFTGDTVSDAIKNGMKRYGNAYCAPCDHHSSTPFFKAYAERWFTLYHVPKVKVNTANNTRIILHRHLYPVFGHQQLDEITADDIQTFFNTKAQLCRSTVQKMKIVLHQVFQSAIEDDILLKNPAESSRLTISKKVVERKALTIAEVADIIRQLPFLTESDRAFVMLPLYTGMRRSEVLGVKWSDVNFEQKYISVTRGITFTGNKPVIGPPKSAAGYRMVPLLPELENFLRHMKQTGTYIIGGNLITETVYKRTWERISRTIDLHGATAHIFRHTFATVAAPHLDVKTLQTIMGHADIETTLDRYTHPQEKRVLAASQTLGRVFSDF